MELNISNVGMIKDLSISIDGLSVIAGENDSGKSTVGKTIFGVIKASQMSKGSFFYKNRTKYIKGIIRDFKNALNYLLDNKEEYDKIALKINNLEKDINFILSEKNRDEKKKAKIADLFLKLDIKLEEINKFKSNVLYPFSDKFREEFRKYNLENILGYLDLSLRNSEILLKTLSKQTDIKANEKIEVFKDGGVFFKDVTYIDSPVIFQLIDLLNEMDSKEYMATIKDLRNKLVGLPNKVELNDTIKDDVYNFITNIINGEVKENKGIFEFVKRDCGVFSIKQTATGIKALGIIMILIKKNWLIKDTLLILDEPEVHIHPKWQLLYAELIAKLVKSEIKVLVNTHSPYMLDALKYFSEKYQIKHNFYLMKKVDNCNSISLDITNDLSEAFELLTQPLRELHQLKQSKR